MEGSGIPKIRWPSNPPEAWRFPDYRFKNCRCLTVLTRNQVFSRTTIRINTLKTIFKDVRLSLPIMSEGNWQSRQKEHWLRADRQTSQTLKGALADGRMQGLESPKRYNLILKKELRHIRRQIAHRPIVTIFKKNCREKQGFSDSRIKEMVSTSHRSAIRHTNTLNMLPISINKVAW